MFRTPFFLAAFVLLAASAQSADKPPGAEKPKQAMVELERKLLGNWEGPACGGDWHFTADGAFEAVHYSPGNYQLSGTWELRWNALPPTLVRTCKTSDDPDQAGVGKTWEVKLTQLDDESLAYQDPDQYPAGHTVRYTRIPAPETTVDHELAALQGTWVPLQYEEGGKTMSTRFTRHIIRGDKVTVQVNGEKISEGKVKVDPTKNPRQLDFEFPNGQTHYLIYVRVGDHVVYCGNRDREVRPAEFASGTAKGGEYLMAWKIEK